MYDKHVFLTVLTLSLVSIWPVAAQDHDHEHAYACTGETAYYLAEHGDFEIGLEDGQLGLHIHLHAGAIVDGEPLAEDTSFEPSQQIVVATHEALQLRPAGDVWRATGVDVNEPLWVLPQHEREGLPAFGISTEEIDVGTLVNDVVTLELRYSHGPGDVSLWASDAFGQPDLLLSTHEQKLRTSLPVGLHAHCNWGFSAPGTYTLIFEVIGDLVAGSRTCALAVYTFLISEGPVLLQRPAADVNSDGVVDETDLQIVQENLGQTAVVWPRSGQDNESDHGTLPMSDLPANDTVDEN